MNKLLGREVHVVGWQTPKVATGKYQYVGLERKKYLNLEGEADLVTGQSSNGNHVPMEGCEGYLLNPNFSRWLQGYPVEWQACADMAMQSIRKSRQSS